MRSGPMRCSEAVRGSDFCRPPPRQGVRARKKPCETTQGSRSAARIHNRSYRKEGLLGPHGLPRPCNEPPSPPQAGPPLKDSAGAPGNGGAVCFPVQPSAPEMASEHGIQGRIAIREHPGPEMANEHGILGPIAIREHSGPEMANEHGIQGLIAIRAGRRGSPVTVRRCADVSATPRRPRPATPNRPRPGTPGSRGSVLHRAVLGHGARAGNGSARGGRVR